MNDKNINNFMKLFHVLLTTTALLIHKLIQNYVHVKMYIEINSVNKSSENNK